MIKKTLIIFAFSLLSYSIAFAADTDAEKLKQDYLVSGIHQKGIEYFNQKKWDQALYNFEQSFKLNPANDTVRQNLLVTYGEIMVGAAEKKDWNRVNQIIPKAMRVVSTPKDQAIFWNVMQRIYHLLLKESNFAEWKSLTDVAVKQNVPADIQKSVSVSLHNLAVEASRKAQVALAIQLANQSIEMFPNYETYSLLGDLYYQSQDLGDARTAWQAAARIKNTDRIKRKLKRIKEEIPLEDSLDEIETDHFIIRLNKAEWEKSGKPLLKVLDSAYAELAHDFQYEPKKKIVIIFYNPEDFYDLNRAPHWSGGFYDGKVRLPFGVGFWERQYQKVVYHELTHGFVFAIAKGKCPTWLNEGFAQMEENKIDPISLAVFLAARKTGALFSLDTLSENPDNFADSLEVSIYYQQSFMVTKYLINKYGWKEMRLLLVKLGKGVPFQQAFFEMTRQNFRAFEIEWLASLNPKHAVG